MKNHKLIFTVSILFASLTVTGCGPSKEDLAAKERARIEQEKQAQADAAKANKAITDMNKKMFSKMNASRTGSQEAQPTQNPPEKKSESPKP